MNNIEKYPEVGILHAPKLVATLLAPLVWFAQAAGQHYKNLAYQALTNRGGAHGMNFNGYRVGDANCM